MNNNKKKSTIANVMCARYIVVGHSGKKLYISHISIKQFRLNFLCHHLNLLASFVIVALTTSLNNKIICELESFLFGFSVVVFFCVCLLTRFETSFRNDRHCVACCHVQLKFVFFFVRCSGREASEKNYT